MDSKRDDDAPITLSPLSVGTLETAEQVSAPSLQPITVELWIDGLPPSPNQIRTVRQKMAVKKEWREKVRFVALEVKAREHLQGLYESCSIHYHISVGDNRRHDPDNLLFSVVKVANDALTGVLIEDDNIDQIKLGFTFGREKPRGFKITITGR